MTAITKDELAAMITALESQPHLSLKEEKYLAIMRELHIQRAENVKLWAWVETAEQVLKRGCQ